MAEVLSPEPYDMLGGGEEIAIFIGMEKHACPELRRGNLLAIPQSTGGGNNDHQRL